MAFIVINVYFGFFFIKNWPYLVGNINWFHRIYVDTVLCHIQGSSTVYVTYGKKELGQRYLCLYVLLLTVSGILLVFQLLCYGMSNDSVTPFGGIHKPCRHGNGEGVTKCPYHNISLTYLKVKLFTKVGWVQKCPKIYPHGL